LSIRGRLAAAADPACDAAAAGGGPWRRSSGVQSSQ